MANPNGFNYFRVGEPFLGLGSRNTYGFNYFYVGEPYPELLSLAALRLRTLMGVGL